MVEKVLKAFRDIAVASNPVTIYCDIMVALAYAKDPNYHGKTKHIHIRYHFVRDGVAKKKVVLEHISTSQMAANPLTKPISIPRTA